MKKKPTAQIIKIPTELLLQVVLSQYMIRPIKFTEDLNIEDYKAVRDKLIKFFNPDAPHNMFEIYLDQWLEGVSEDIFAKQLWLFEIAQGLPQDEAEERRYTRELPKFLAELKEKHGDVIILQKPDVPTEMMPLKIPQNIGHPRLVNSAEATLKRYWKEKTRNLSIFIFKPTRKLV